MKTLSSPSINSSSIFVFICVLIAGYASQHDVNAFSIPIHRQNALHQHRPFFRTVLKAGFGKNEKPSKSTVSSKKSLPSPELFELQELRAQLKTILDKNMLYQSLSDEKRAELTKYVKAVVERSESPIDVGGKRNSMGPMQFVAGIENKSWRMVFSTDRSSDGAGQGDAELPYGSTVVFRIGMLEGAKGSLDYVLKFSKQIMGLKELVAKSSCEVDVSCFLKFS